jgi:uncharacterized protein YecE (DUF72 family)
MMIGSCSWKYPEWGELVYAEGSENLLEQYARKFSTVEIDQWFWSLFAGGIKLPDPAVAAEYAASVPDDFRFTIKLPDSLSLTHFRGKEQGLKINPHFLDREFLERSTSQIGDHSAQDQGTDASVRISQQTEDE